MPNGSAVSASPKLWIRSASSAMLSLARNMSVCATAASPSTASDSDTARMPSRERLMLSSISPCE